MHLSTFISGGIETPLEQAAGELAFCLFRLGKPVCVGAADVEYCLPVLGNSFAADAVDAEQVGFFGGREDDEVGQADVGKDFAQGALFGGCLLGTPSFQLFL